MNLDLETFRTLSPVCPHCHHELTDDEMNANPTDLWALAPGEDRAEVTCPDVMCGKTYHVQGGYVPHYTTAIDEDDL